jgi:hypothetical protein
MKTEIDFRQPAPQVFNAWPPAHVSFAECHCLCGKAPGKDNAGFIQLVKKELFLKTFAHPTPILFGSMVFGVVNGKLLLHYRKKGLGYA